METDFRTDTVAIKKLMIERNIKNISELSKKTNVSRNTLSSVLRGKTQPSLAVMGKLVNALEISPEDAGKIFFVKTLRNT